MTEIVLPKNTYTAEPAKVTSKLARFKADGHAKLHVVSDFDLTLTAGRTFGQNVGTWDVMDELLPPEGVAKHAQIYQSFRPIERAGQLTEAIAIEKWSETLDLITGYPIALSDIQKAFLNVAQLRSGGKALFDACEKAQIPTVILCAGIRYVVEVIAEHYGLRPGYILGTELTVDDRGVITGWKPDTLVHLLNKKERGHHELKRLRDERPNVILIGDTPQDVDMAIGVDNVLRVRVLDQRKGEADPQHKVLADTFAAGYDIAVDHDLSPIAELIENL